MLSGRGAIGAHAASVGGSFKFCFSIGVPMGAKRSIYTDSPAGEPKQELFTYTSGRWLYNEARRLEERHREFDVSALAQAACRAVGRTPSDVQSFTKIAEGGFNRIFNIRMKDGYEIIARLPYSITQPRKFAIASEVATIAFLRAHGIPTPKVFSYQTSPDNPVGAEYIVMEKVQGRLLADEWFNLTDKQRIRLLAQIAETEAKIFKLDLPAYGSLFFEDDLPRNVGRTGLQTSGDHAGAFCIGPDVSLRNWFQDRSNLDIPRGPARSPTEVLQTAAEKEIAFLRRFAKPRFPYERVYRDITNFRKSSPGEHAENLHLFLQVCQHLVPTAEWLQKPTLRHPDLSPHNIFISEDTQITGIIDWQHSCILPFFLNAGIPAHFSNYGDPESEALTKPTFPTNLDELDEDERSRDLELYRRRHLHFYYVGATLKKAPQHYEAMMYEGNMFRQRIFQHASAPWEGDNIALQADLVRLTESWHDLVVSGPACPISFSKETAQWTLQAMQKQSEADDQLRILTDMLVGSGTDGWVSNDRYIEALSKATSLKKGAIAAADDDTELEEIRKAWPFDDYDEDE